MKIAFDIKRMRPGCVLLAAALGADPEAAHPFNSKHWLLEPTPDMKVYNITSEQLKELVEKVEDTHRGKDNDNDKSG